jgi:hypothetical protein
MGKTSGIFSVKIYGNIFVRVLFNGAVSTKQLYKMKFDLIKTIKLKNKLYETISKFSFLRRRRK